MSNQNLIKNHHSDSKTLTLQNIGKAKVGTNSPDRDENVESIWVIVFHVNGNPLRQQKRLNQFLGQRLIGLCLSEDRMFSLLPASKLYSLSAYVSICYIPLGRACVFCFMSKGEDWSI